jgi:hypothetical protein
MDHAGFAATCRSVLLRSRALDVPWGLSLRFTSQEKEWAMDSWLRMFSPAIDWHLPASGDVTMDYKPRIFHEIALPGKQLGKLIEAVLALAERIEQGQPEVLKSLEGECQAINDLRRLNTDIQCRKEQLQGTLKGRATQALDDLQRGDRESYRSLIGEKGKEITDADA